MEISSGWNPQDLLRDPKLKDIIVLTLIVKVCIFIVIFLGINFFPFAIGFHNANFVYPPGEHITFWTALKTWDGQHFTFLAEKGYMPNQASDVVYPLFPVIVGFFRPIFLGNTIVAGLVLANVFSLFAIILFYLFVKSIYDEKAAFNSSLFLLAFPTSFYFSLIYSDSLFLLLSMIFMISLYQKWFIPALASAFLLPLSRAQGILFLLPLFVYLVMLNVKGGKLKPGVFREYFIPLVMLAGYAAYFLFMKHYTGSFFTAFEIQDKYMVGHHSILKVLHPIQWFTDNFVNINFTLHGFTTSIINRLFFLGFLALISPAVKKLDPVLLAFLLAMGLVPALTSNFIAYIRYILAAFPIFIVLAIVLKEKHYLLLVPMIVLQTIFLLMHSLNFWVA